MQFLFVGSALCFRLPSDSASRPTPLPSAHRSPCRASREDFACSAHAAPPGVSPCRAQSGRRRGHPRRPPTPPYVRFRIRRFTKPSASIDGVREGSPVHLCSLGSPLPLPAVTFDAPLALPRRFRRLLPAADSGISAILSSVCFVIEVRASTPAPCSGLRPRRAGLLCPLLTSDGSAAPLDAPCRTSATRPQTSPGKVLPPSRLCPLHLLPRVPYRYRTSGLCAPSSHAAASHAVPVRQASALLPASFRSRLATGTLAFR